MAASSPSRASSSRRHPEVARPQVLLGLVCGVVLVAPALRLLQCSVVEAPAHKSDLKNTNTICIAQTRSVALPVGVPRLGAHDAVEGEQGHQLVRQQGGEVDHGAAGRPAQRGACTGLCN